MHAFERPCDRHELEPFDRILLDSPNVESELRIQHGERESLEIEASQRLLSQIQIAVRERRLVMRVAGDWVERLGHALKTSLTRERVRYRLTVRRLTGLDLIGLVDGEVTSLSAERLTLRMRGMGRLRIGQLQARQLEVDLTGPCRVDLAGRVEAQRITLRAMGSYRASGLESQETTVEVLGPGWAAVRAADRLAVRVVGPGQVQYYGRPRVSSSLSPVGNLVYLGA